VGELVAVDVAMLDLNDTVLVPSASTQKQYPNDGDLR
jgi:hypothetical protein